MIRGYVTLAGIIDLLSNNSDLTLTPDGLRKLAIPQGPRSDASEPGDFQIHRLSARLSAKQIEDVIRRYEAGESARSLAAEVGIAPSALIRLLRERNVVVRRQTVTPDQEEMMARDYEAGMTVAELKEKHGISHGAVLRALHRLGIEMRSKAPRRKSR
jgi:DNA-directed RNA polymerase specialized sigma24 family protein